MKKRHPHKKIWFLAAALAVCLLFGGILWPQLGAGDLLGEEADGVPQLFSRLFSAWGDTLRQGADYFRGIRRLQEENETLEAQVVSLTQAAQEGEWAKQENQALRKLLGLQEQGLSLTLLPAQVIEETDGGQVTLDQGSRQGVETGQLVTDLSGALVGRVTQVQEDTAQVTLTWAAGFSLWVSSGDGTVRGLLRGGGVQGVALFTTMTQEPELGETLVTFAPGGTYPSGLPVGTLTGRTADTGGLTRRGRVTLGAGVCLADSVFILTGFQEEAA